MNGVLRSSRAEVLRLRKWPAVWVTLGAWIFLALLFGYLFNYVSFRSGDTSFSNDGLSRQALLQQLLPANMPDVLIQGMPMFGGALMMVLGAIVAGNGYAWGTWKTVFTQGTSRGQTIVGSLLTLAAFVVGVVLLTLVLFAVVSSTVAITEGVSLVWPSAIALLKAFGVGCLVLELFALAGYTVGTLARGPALAVGLGLVWVLVVEPLLRGVGSLLGPVQSFADALPGATAGSLVGSVIGDQADSTPGVLHELGGTTALIGVVLYAVAFAAITLTLVNRRDVA